MLQGANNAWYHLNFPKGTLMRSVTGAPVRATRFHSGGSEPTFGALQTDARTDRVLSLL